MLSERDSSRDRHQHSFSESYGGRASVPMWDSSDPDRAPPPLPLAPNQGSPTTKANTSASIAAAAKQIVERARETAPLSSYTRNPKDAEMTPERSLVKGTHHRRLQSLQPGSVKDLRSYLDNSRSPERSPERPMSRSACMPYNRMTSHDDLSLTPDRASSPTPAERPDPTKDTPTLRATPRQPPRSILGENTPPSATMLALQTMHVPDPPLSDITNGPSTPGGSRTLTNYDFSSQLLNLTTIATNLQKEMAQLSRRSKDNATDLLTLKEATTSRDEDIRKSLRDLASTVTITQQGLLGPPPPLTGSAPRSTSGHSAPQFLESKGFSSPPSASKGYTLPRAASAHSFLDERCGSPSPYSVEGAASVAMLEKIIREMVTKDGQDRLLSTLSELLEKSREENSDAAKKVEELSTFIRERQESQALVSLRSPVTNAPKLDLNFDAPQKAKDQDPTAKEEIFKVLQRIKDSVAHSGGTSAEVKGLVRDLRGEVLGMGRELGKKLDQISESSLNNTLDRSINDGRDTEHVEEVHRVVQEEIHDLKLHLAHALKERAEQDDDAFRQLASTRPGPNGEDMLAIVKHALAEQSASKQESDIENVGLDREGVLHAVKEGLKDFEPNIELQQFGLERDEILSVLREGLEDYQRRRVDPVPAVIDKGEIFEIMQDALKDFRAPAPIPTEQLVELKEELLSSLRETLEEYVSSLSSPSMDNETIQATIFEAVKEGFANHPSSAARELEINRDDLFDAVRSSLDGSAIPFGGFGEQVLSQLRELIDGMRVEFKQYSAANGRDTEQVLDAVKDGLEALGVKIESYVDKTQDVTNREEIVATVRSEFDQLRHEVQGFCALQNPSQDGGKAEMLEYIRAEFEHLHEEVSGNNSSRNFEESHVRQTTAVIMALKEGLDDLKSHWEGRDDSTSTEELNEAMKEEFEQLKGAILHASAADKNELIETIQDCMGALHSKLNGSEFSHTSPSSAVPEEMMQMVQDELATLKESIHAMVSEVDKDAIVDGVRQAIDDLRIQLSGDQNDASAEALGALKQELDSFRDSFGNSLVVSGNSADHAEALHAIRSTLEEVREVTSKRGGQGGMSDEQLEAFRGEFENLRNSIANSVVHQGSNEEVLEAMRLGLDDLRSHLEKRLDNPEAAMEHQNQLLDALNEGLDTARMDILNSLKKQPIDQTIHYEILESLKSGLASLHAGMDKLSSRAPPHGGEVVLADGAELDASEEGAAPSAGHNIKRADFDRVEVLLSQLQMKIEALENTVHDIPSHQQSPSTQDGAATKENLLSLESMIREIQESVIGLAAAQREGVAAPEGAARREDTDAIETLLRNTKAYLEEIALPDSTTAATREHLEEVHTSVRMAHEAMDSLADRLETTTASKADVAVVEVLTSDIKAMMEEMKGKDTDRSGDDEERPMTKADLDALGVLCTEIKARVHEFVMPDLETLPSRHDIEQLRSLVTEFRESHDSMKDSYENDIAVTAKAFDDRKHEHEETAAQLAEVKVLLDEVKSELLERLSDGEIGVNALGETLKGIEQRSNEDAMDEVKEVLHKLREEVEHAHESLGAIKVDHSQSAETALEKQSEHRAAVVAELSDKLDGLFDGLLSKYEEAESNAETRARAMDEKVTQQQDLFDNMKTMADDLRLSIDTLGTTLTTFIGELPGTVEKMAEESKTVFNQVVATHARVEETADDLRAEHAATREEVTRVLAAVDVVQNEMAEHNPRFMVTLEEVRALINQHYEHSQRSSQAATDHVQAVRDLQDALKAGFEDSKAQAHAHQEGLRSHHEELKTALPALLPPPVEAQPDKYDDTVVHEKLDKLMSHVEEAASRSTQLERLDQIHDKVMATAAEVSAFVAAQNRQISNDHESKEKEAEEIALLLERRMERKDQLEADITVLNAEKESLANAVEALRAEKEALAAQKSRLNADVSSLETALQIRREELHEMDNKAALIERRMLDGVMSQSRMLLLSKATKPASPSKKKPQGRDLRVTSNASAASAQTVTSSVPALRANHALAMKSRTAANTTERRIASLNQINHNVPTGAHAFSTENKVSLRPANAMKRSHSVKTQPMRKLSWAGKRNISLSSQNKENETLSEEDEDEDEVISHTAGDELGGSEAGTERRTSYLSGTDGGNTYATDSYMDPDDENETAGTEDGRRRVASGYAPSDMTYDTGSYLTGSYLSGSEIDRRPSMGSSANGVVGATAASATAHHDEHSEEDEDEGPSPQQQQQLQLEDAAARSPADFHKRAKFEWAPPSDSGLGTDLPTALMSDGETYFK